MSANASTSTHVIIGAGQIGRKLAAELLARGHQVRLVRRGAPGAAQPKLSWMRGDILDPRFADEACRGAEVVYNCCNPSDYAAWDGVMEPLHEAVQDAAVRSGARLVSLDCLYMVGLPEQVPFDEDVPMRPCSDKGRMRARLVERALELQARGDLRVSFGRAPDFFGPDSPLSLFGERFLERVRAGKAAEVFGDPDLPRSYAYTPDVARGLALLGTDARALERSVWHLPVLEVATTRALVEAFYAAAGQPAKLRPIPRWMLALGGLASPLLRAAKHMVYQWEHPYVVDDRHFRQTFAVAPTSVEQAVARTLGDRSSSASAAA
jgi:nucleoside-diphosphate-sugar epimerase